MTTVQRWEDLRELDRAGINYVEEEDLFRVSKQLDVLYSTRIQKERFTSEKEYNKVKNAYVLDKSLLRSTKISLKIMHPLPRVNEIKPELDAFPNSVYFRQAHNGVTVRKALLAMVLGKA